MRILTVRRPWAWALVHAGKNVENRQTNVAGKYRGPVAIHAGLQADSAVDEYEHPMHGLVYPPCPNRRYADHNEYSCTWCSVIAPQRHAHAGHIIGVAELVRVHQAKSIEEHQITSSTPLYFNTCCSSPWAEVAGAWHLVFEQPRPLTEPLPYKGMLGLRRLDADSIARIEAAIA